MSAFLDLVAVDYLNRTGIEICYAPSDELKEGDAVVTQFGEGKVVDIINAWSEDKVFKFFKCNTKIWPVLYKPIKYEEENDDLSERRDD